MRPYDDIFVLQALVLAWNHCDDVVCMSLHIGFHKREIMVETLILLLLDNRLQLQSTELAGDIFRSKRITCCGRKPASQFLRCQILHRLPHVILPLSLCLQHKRQCQE